MLELRQGQTLISIVQNGQMFALPDGRVVSPAYAGWVSGDGFSIVEVPDPTPPAPTLAELRAGMRLSRRQMLIALASEGLITSAEAVAWASSNTLPAPIEAMVTALPTPGAQMAARITLATFTVAERLDPMVPMLAAVAPVPLTDLELDAFFTGYAAL